MVSNTESIKGACASNYFRISSLLGLYPMENYL